MQTNAETPWQPRYRQAGEWQFYNTRGRKSWKPELGPELKLDGETCGQSPWEICGSACRVYLFAVEAVR